MLDLLDVAVPALENDYAGQAVLDAIRATHADLARQLQGSRWSPHGRKPPQEPRSSQALQLGGNGVKHAP